MNLSDIDHVYNLLVEHDRIGAIKAFRAATNWGLKESKDFVVGAYGRQTAHEFRTAAINEFVAINEFAPSPVELLAEFATHVRRLEQIIVQFAELCDSQTPTPTDTERVWTGDWRILKPGDAVKYKGCWYEVTATQNDEYRGVWPVAIKNGDNGEYWLKYSDNDKEFVEVILK